MSKHSPLEPALRQKALRVHERLCALYGCPIAYFASKDPLSTLVSALLSHRTKNASTGKSFRALVARFPTWQQVRDAPTAEVEQAIALTTWPEQKAPRIQAVLRQVTALRGESMSLDFLGELTVAQARAWLERLPGVGPKTSGAVLAFSTLRKPALVVDSHHHRVAQRLGLIPPRMDEGPAHAFLAAELPFDWDAQKLYDNHEILMLHGQRVCTFHEPSCGRCVVLDQCPFGRQRLGLTTTEPAQNQTSQYELFPADAAKAK